MKMSYYDKNGKEITVMEWARLFENWDYKKIKQDTLLNGCLISTVWLGLNHSFSKDELLIFETMIFNTEKNVDDLDCDRYSTIQEAIDGHEKMKEKWSKK